MDAKNLLDVIDTIRQNHPKVNILLHYYYFTKELQLVQGHSWI